jgi:hypothetical protein
MQLKQKPSIRDVTHQMLHAMKCQQQQQQQQHMAFSQCRFTRRTDRTAALTAFLDAQV